MTSMVCLFMCMGHMQGHEGDAVPGVPKGKDSDSFTQDQMKTFSKRKIISNWAKYDEGMCFDTAV